MAYRDFYEEIEGASCLSEALQIRQEAGNSFHTDGFINALFNYGPEGNLTDFIDLSKEKGSPEVLAFKEAIKAFEDYLLNREKATTLRFPSGLKLKVVPTVGWFMENGQTWLSSSAYC